MNPHSRERGKLEQGAGPASAFPSLSSLPLLQPARIVARREDFWERAAFPSPREERVGRGSGGGALPENVPPLPGPLLHPME